MFRAGSENLTNEFTRYIQSWFDLIAFGDAEKACSVLDRSNNYGLHWTPECIDNVLFENFGPGSVFFSEHPEGPVVTSVASTNETRTADIIKYSDGTGYSVEHEVPLNGEWSELWAQFEFIGSFPEFEVVLHDLHVL